MDRPTTTVSEKVKEHLNRKVVECEHKLLKLKRKRNIVKTCYVVTVLLSITNSGIVSVIISISAPVMIIPILSSFSAILTGISVRFNFHDKKAEIKRLIEKLNKIKSKLEYVISCNGDLTQADYEEILKNF
jgi:hypothetical protein